MKQFSKILGGSHNEAYKNIRTKEVNFDELIKELQFESNLTDINLDLRLLTIILFSKSDS